MNIPHSFLNDPTSLVLNNITYFLTKACAISVQNLNMLYDIKVTIAEVDTQKQRRNITKLLNVQSYEFILFNETKEHVYKDTIEGIWVCRYERMA